MRLGKVVVNDVSVKGDLFVKKEGLSEETTGDLRDKGKKQKAKTTTQRKRKRESRKDPSLDPSSTRPNKISLDDGSIALR